MPLDEELLRFVNRNIDADEALARGVIERNNASWQCPSTGLVTVSDEDWPISTNDRDVAEHIATHDPARTLAECAAKRYLIAELTNVPPERAAQLGDLPDLTLRLLAASYAWDDDWQPRWEVPRLLEEYGSEHASRVIAGEVVVRAIG